MTDTYESTRTAIGAMIAERDENYYGPIADHEHMSAAPSQVSASAGLRLGVYS